MAKGQTFEIEAVFGERSNFLRERRQAVTSALPLSVFETEIHLAHTFHKWRARVERKYDIFSIRDKDFVLFEFQR